MFKLAIPILGVSNSESAEEFYCGKLGFYRQYAWRPDSKNPDPCYMGLVRDEAHIVISTFEGDGPAGSRNVQIYVDDEKTIYEEFKRAGVPSIGEFWEQSWGNLEFSFVDLDGNRICIAQDQNS